MIIKHRKYTGILAVRGGIKTEIEFCCKRMNAAFAESFIQFGHPDGCVNNDANLVVELPDGDYEVMSITACPFCKAEITVSEVEVIDEYRAADALAELEQRRGWLASARENVARIEKQIGLAEEAYRKIAGEAI